MQSHYLLFEHTQAATIRTALERITAIARVIYTHGPRIVAREASKSTAHFLFYTDTIAVAFGSAAGLRGVFDAGPALVAGLVVAASAAANWVYRDRGVGMFRSCRGL